jgi:hypothetical protein
MFNDLHKLAWEAEGEGRAAEFLDGLDQRARTDFDPGPRFKDFADKWYDTCVVGGGLRESRRESDRSMVAFS